MKFSIFITIISLLLISCSSIKKVVLLDQQLKNDATISTTDYSQHKLKEGDILHIKIIGVQEEAFNILILKIMLITIKQHQQIFFLMASLLIVKVILKFLFLVKFISKV